jgi:hypothetical protein
MLKIFEFSAAGALQRQRLLCGAVNQLARYVILPVRVAVKLSQKVGKKEYFQYGKHDEQLDEDNRPQGFADGHAAETLSVEAEYAYRYGENFSHALQVWKVYFIYCAANAIANMNNFIGILSATNLKCRKLIIKIKIVFWRGKGREGERRGEKRREGGVHVLLI